MSSLSKISSPRSIRALTSLFVLFCSLHSFNTSGGELSYDAALNIGPEADTNTNRVPRLAVALDSGITPSPTTGLLLRTMAELNSRYVTPKSYTTIGYEGGYKFFLASSQRASNEHVHRLRVNALQRLGGEWELSEMASYFDDFLKVSTRDFRRGLIGFALRKWFTASRGTNRARERSNVIADRFQIALNPSLSALQYKPADSFSFVAPGAMLSFGYEHPIDGQSSLGLSLSTTSRYRIFRGEAFCEPGTCATGQKASNRQDFNSLTRLAMSIDSDMMFSLWYGIELNRSNSFGESYRRHIVGLDVTAPITERFFFSGQAVYQLSAFSDTLFGQSIQQLVVPVEQENRSRLVVRLGYDWTNWLSASVWYSLFVNESGTTAQGQAIPGYFRQTLFTGLEFHHSSR